MKKREYLLFIILLIHSLVLHASSDMNFSGTLVDEPCSLAPDDSAIDVNFGTVINKLLYSHQRTPGKPFTLHLLECDLSLGNKVSITFAGQEDPDQPGLIALDANSTVRGVAVGIETLDNNLIYINKATEYQNITPGSNALNYQIFISAEREAIVKKNILPGLINAQVIFTLNYE